MNNENKNNLLNTKEIIYLIYNGMATAGIVHNANQLIDKGYERETIIILLMWIIGFAYSAHRLYQIYKIRQEENQNNQKQR